MYYGKEKNKCAAGPNCLPYLVWKKVPIFAEALYKVFEMIFTKKQYPESWGLAYVSMLPKPNSDGKDITKARPIAVGNCDGKLSNSFLQEAMTTHTLAKFPFQKGFLRCTWMYRTCFDNKRSPEGCQDEQEKLGSCLGGLSRCLWLC